MLPCRPYAALCAAGLAATVAAPASAQPALVASTPAADAEVASTDALQLAFSEAVSATASRADLVMTSMPGMATMPLMRMAVKLAASPDPQTLRLTTAAPLPAGTYRLTWSTAGADKAPASGVLAFTVR